MGVHGLWRLLESTGKPINPETLEGKILAVDISIWLNQAVKGVRDREGNSVHNAHLLTLFHRICKLLFFRIRPVFVFDGDAPLLKKQTLALRRQRKEELTRESRNTNEKLLKTFLKRQAIKAALGDHSKEPLPSLSSVRRNEVDDMYVLPALPPAEEKAKSSSEEEEEEREEEEMVDSYYMYQGEVCEDPNSMDINSEEFASLPPEMKHEILKDMKEFSKRRRTMFHKPPERSGDFSQYQLAGLLQRNRLNQRLEGVEKEMNHRSAGSAPDVCQQDGAQHSVEAQRLVSEDHSHYILIKGSKKSETAPESQPAAAPWAGSSLSGCQRRAKDKPEPLWRPVCEEEDKAQATSSGDSKPSASKPSDGDASPPSPRTLRAIQAVINDSSDEEKSDRVKTNGGSMSPRTLLAIQQVLAEDEGGAAGFKSSSPTNQTNIHHRAPRAVTSSSEEEAEPSLKEKDLNTKLTGQNLHDKDGLLDSSSEDEMEELIGQRNKALRLAAKEISSEDRMRKAELSEDIKTSCPTQVEKQEQLSGRPAALLEQFTEAPEKNGYEVKSESSEENESEESFIEVSEDDSKEETADDSLVITGEKAHPDEVHKDDAKAEGNSEESLTEISSTVALNSEEEAKAQNEMKEETETESRSAPAINEWEHFDVDELQALESSLQVEQSNLREQKQQQERMANTVTGQMYLESQELLRLFGVPYLVAPMEAEAQCAALDWADHTHGTITDDSDVWLFGGRHVYKNFFSQDKYVEHYQYSDLQSQLGLDRTKMINLAYLLGSDYTEGVPGVGYVTGMEILNEFPGPGLEPLIQFSNWWSEAQEKKRLVSDPRDTKVKKKLRDVKLQPGFPNPVVAQAYLHPTVDQSESFFSWGRPQLDMIKEFCLSRFGWSSRKTEETLQPVIKQLNTQQTQLRIDSFFRMEQREKQAIRSQRLRRAVTCLKRKEREGGAEEEEDDSEDDTHSPSKSKKGSQDKGGEEKDVRRSVAGGGFLGSEMTDESPLTALRDSSSTSHDSLSVKTVPQSNKTPPKRTRMSSSSSGEDSDGGPGVAMVTARSVFEGSRRGRGAKSTRGRGSMRGKGRGKKT
uniref:Excision repair cross-complementation group 5 n=1 Tax=Oreochromis niloticus TaxID=8128 RepID=I3J4Y1_ORENI